MTRHSYQRGYVSDPIRTRRGTAFKIRYRIRTADGKWLQKSETLYDLQGKRAARDLLDKRINDASPLKFNVSDLTFAGLTETYWKQDLDRKCVKPSTRLCYESALKLHVIPALGNHRIIDIAPLHIEQFSQTKLAAGLSPKTVRNLLGLIQGIFAVAVDNDLVPRSPVRKRHKPAIQRREKPIWAAEQVRAILQSAPRQFLALFACVGLTGLRLGELLALQWKHINLQDRKFKIEQSLWQGKLGSPKTTGSIRTVYFGPWLTHAFKAQLAAAVHNQPENFVFCKRDGSPLHPDVLRKDVLYPILDRLRINRESGSSGFHTFRHSVASFINAETGNLKLAQKLLGHSTIGMTADVYTHTTAESEREASLAVERAIYGDLFPVVPNLGNRNNSDEAVQ